MKRWGTEAECLSCGTKSFFLHARIPDLAGTPKAKCARCGTGLQLTAKGYGGAPAPDVSKWLGGSTQVDPKGEEEQRLPGPGSNLTPQNHERCTLTPEEQKVAAELLSIALPEGVNL